MNKNNLMREFP